MWLWGNNLWCTLWWNLWSCIACAYAPYSMRMQHATVHDPTDLKFGSCIVLSSSSLWLKLSLSRSRVGLKLHLCVGASNIDCVRTILTTFTTCTIITMQLLG
jgi:hypothetical protein